MGEVWTVGRVLEAAETVARQRRVELRRTDTALCLAEQLGLDRLGLLLAHERPLSPGERARFRKSLERLLAGEPIAYVLGHQQFYSRRFEVSPAVLIPRPETELLVEKVLSEVPHGALVFEPCTGSGCIAATLVLERPDLRLVATDVSAAALEVAERNAAALGAADRIDFRLGSWWEPVAGGRFDALVANAPYVDFARPDLLGPGVEHEPRVALESPLGRPLYAYEQLARGCARGLRPGAGIYLEVGVDTAAGVRELFGDANGYSGTRLDRDLAGLPRIVSTRFTATGSDGECLPAAHRP